MAKKFNVTGLCFPHEHYMADISKKLEKTIRMVEAGDYFIINRPRQYGKTTMLYMISDVLQQKGDYLLLNTSFEGLGDAAFENEAVFSQEFVELLRRCLKYDAPQWLDWLVVEKERVISISRLSDFITDFIGKIDQKVVLLIDEVDKSSNNQLFVSFLAMLRQKYLDRSRAKTFHSVVLAGLHDVKSLKLKLRPNEEQKLNSPWNIASEYNVDLNFSAAEIKPMLVDYVQETGVTVDVDWFAQQLFYYTSGYPFLVSRLCKMIDEHILPTKNTQDWTEKDLETAVYKLCKEDNTNFESLIKNLENYPDLYRITQSILMDGDYLSYNIHDPIVNLGMLHGIFKNGYGVKIHNRIYEEVIYDYMTSKAKSGVLLSGYYDKMMYRKADNSLNMELVLRKFQVFMKEQYSIKDADFVERNGRLLFLAFIKPIINGSGFDFKEAQVSEERRLDVVITFFNNKYLTELKIWYGDEAHKKGLGQLADYLDRQGLETGYLLIFDKRKERDWATKWTRKAGKRIFCVWV
jgi:hypothetical protein